MVKVNIRRVEVQVIWFSPQHWEIAQYSTPKLASLYYLQFKIIWLRTIESCSGIQQCWMYNKGIELASHADLN